jgi:hypothetical protein
MNDIAAPSWDKLCMHIFLKTDWKSPLPERYLSQLIAWVGDDSSQVSGLTRRTTGTNLTGTNPARTGRRAKEMHTRQTPANQESVAKKCNPYLEALAPFRATGKRVRKIIRAATLLAGNPIPQNDRRVGMCVSYHVKGDLQRQLWTKAQSRYPQ